MTDRIVATCVNAEGKMSELHVQLSGHGISSPLLPQIEKGIRATLERAVAGDVRVLHVRTVQRKQRKASE